MNIFLDKASRDACVGVRVKKSRRSRQWRELSPISKSRGKPPSLSRIYSSQVEKILQQRPVCPKAMVRLCSPGQSRAPPKLPRHPSEPPDPPLVLSQGCPAPRLLPGWERSSPRGLMADPQRVVTLVTGTCL